MNQTHLIIMKSFTLGSIGLLFLASNAHQIIAHEFVFGTMVIKHPVIRIVEETPRKAEGYVEIFNNGPKNEKLVGAALEGTSKTGHFQLHNRNDALSKSMFRDGIEIKAGQSLHLAPQKDVIIFDEITKDYDEDTYINGSLIFSSAGAVKIEFLVSQTKENVQKLPKK
ncbi:MAG: copper chaperone PCu(A)C [Hyphomicrobium sp.]